MKTLAPMPTEKTFFATVYHDGVIYTFGGYDAINKEQISDCQYYSLRRDKWFNSEMQVPKAKIEYKLHRDRSQASSCLYDTDTIFIFGGYHKDEGTLDIIERFNINSKSIELLKLRIPSPLRRF